MKSLGLLLLCWSLLFACGSTTPVPAPVVASSQENVLNARLQESKARVAELEQRVAVLQGDLERMAIAAKNAADEHQRQRTAAAPPPTRPQPEPTAVYAVPVGNSPRQGPNDALVTIVRAYEYACPFCEKSRPTMAALLKKYGKQLRIVYKPLIVHPAIATASALAACAAHRQGKWLAMDSLIWDKVFKKRAFDNQRVSADSQQIDCWTNGSCKILNGLAQQLRLNMTNFRKDMARCQPEIEQDIQMLQQFGVSATPSFFVNGRYFSGAQPAENFYPLIDEELQKAKIAIRGGTAAVDYYQRNIVDAGLPSLGEPVPIDR
jgi:protein-disulfide isomerase